MGKCCGVMEPYSVQSLLRCQAFVADRENGKGTSDNCRKFTGEIKIAL
jgi:hypothetical protein